MKSLNNYISEGGGFFNNVRANKEAMKDSVITTILDNMAEINKISNNACNFLICNFGYNLANIDKESIDKYFKVGDNMFIQSNSKTKKHGLSVKIGYGGKWNKECLKKLADTLELFDPNTTTILLRINEKDSGVSMKDITTALKGRLPKIIFSTIFHRCNIEDWRWLDGVDKVLNFDIYNSFIRSFKGIQPKVDNITIDGNTIFDDVNYFPHITRTVMLAHDCVFQNNLSVVKDNVSSDAGIYLN